MFYTKFIYINSGHLICFMPFFPHFPTGGAKYFPTSSPSYNSVFGCSIIFPGECDGVRFFLLLFFFLSWIAFYDIYEIFLTGFLCFCWVWKWWDFIFFFSFFLFDSSVRTYFVYSRKIFKWQFFFDSRQVYLK